MAEPTPGELMRAQGRFVLFVASLLQGSEIVKRDEFGRLLAVFAATVRETEPAEGDILAEWAAGLDQNASN